MRRSSLAKPMSVADLEAAHEKYEAVVPRDLFYQLSLYLMKQAGVGRGPFTRAEALAVLLQTWKPSSYRPKRHPDPAEYLAAIEGLLVEHKKLLAGFAKRSIDSLAPADEGPVRALYFAFEDILGKSGASKALHLLAPRFFPVWDGAIAEKAYGLHSRDDRDYWRLLRATAEQVEVVGGEAALGRNPIKAIAEYNYCRYTLKQKS